MNTARNDTTGDLIQTKPSTCKYREGWTKIWADEQDLAQAAEDKRRDQARELADSIREEMLKLDE
jgi:hypothetical protein